MMVMEMILFISLLLLRLLTMLKKERHSSAQHSPPSRTCEIDTKQRPSGFFSFRVCCCCSCDEILMDFEARLRLGVRQFRVFN